LLPLASPLPGSDIGFCIEEKVLVEIVEEEYLRKPKVPVKKQSVLPSTKKSMLMK
jgi:hypothetical protein